MRAALTQMVIDKLPIPSAKVDHRDTRLKGLVLRVMPSGTKSYYCEYARGKRVWLGRADVLGVMKRAKAHGLFLLTSIAASTRLKRASPRR